MFLNETPHIKLRRANGLINIDYTACDIIGLNQEGPAAARSYNTIIGVYTRDSTGNKIYLEASGVYSTTTSTKHKPRAAAIASYNNFQIIPEVKPEILHELYFYNKYNIDEILQEYQERQKIAAAIATKEPDHPEILHARTAGTIKPARRPTSKDYKNGNRLVKYYYKTNFKFFSNIYFQVNLKAIKKTINKGTRGNFQTNDYKQSIVNITR